MLSQSFLAAWWWRSPISAGKRSNQKNTLFWLFEHLACKSSSELQKIQTFAKGKTNQARMLAICWSQESLTAACDPPLCDSLWRWCPGEEKDSIATNVLVFLSEWHEAINCFYNLASARLEWSCKSRLTEPMFQGRSEQHLQTKDLIEIWNTGSLRQHCSLVKGDQSTETAGLPHRLGGVSWCHAANSDALGS